jgi:signal transduction histidine kinase
MRRDQELIGVLVLGVNGQVREFDKDELSLLKAISDQAAQAIANSRLFQTVSEYAARTEALVEISRTFAKAGLDYQSILNTVARRTAEIIGDACVITLFSDDAKRSFPVAFHHFDPKALSMMHDALMHTWQGGTDTQRYQTLLAGDSIYIPFVDPEEFRASLEPEFWTFFEAIGISSVLIVPLKTDGHVIGTLGITRDQQGNPYTHDDQLLLQNIADRAALSIRNAQLFRQVQGAREQLEALSKRLLEVQEAERRALTTELHDRVGQNLTGLSILLQNLKESLYGKAAQNLVKGFDDAQTVVQDITRHIRDIMAELYLPELEDHGLAAALETYAERSASRGSLNLVIDLPETPIPLSSDVRVALFRAAQEAISNVLKHAEATQVEISLQRENGRLSLKIEDNGQGFESSAAYQKETPSWGLKIMRERIESIGGKVEIESEPGEGTRVTFEIEDPA